MYDSGIDRKQEKVRVLRIIARMNVGGPAVQITSLMLFLPEEKFTQRLLTGNCGNEEIDYLYEKHIELDATRVSGFGQHVSLILDCRAFIKIRRIIRDFHPDIIHTHTAKAGFIGRLASLSILEPHIRVHTFHGHLLQGYFGKVKRNIVIFIERLLARKTHALIAVGHKVKNDLVEAGIGILNQYHVISPGLSIIKGPKKDDALNYLGIKINGFVVGWIGRVVPIKAINRVIEISRELMKCNAKVSFLIAGDGPELLNAKRIAAEENLPITFLGWQTDVELILSVCDLILSTSINEGTPVSLIQAQMAGKPVLATNVGSSSEVLVSGVTGFCLDYSTDRFVAVIQELSSNPSLCQKMGVMAKSFAVKKFATDRLVTDHTKLYLNLINQSNS